jgi:hypothetical protein
MTALQPNMDLHRLFTQNFHPQDETVEIGSCSCKPPVQVHATTNDLPIDFKVKCTNDKTHKWADVQLALPLAYLNPDKPSRPTTKRLMKEYLGSWYVSLQTVPDEMNTQQQVETIHVPWQPEAPEDIEVYINLDDPHESDTKKTLNLNDTHDESDANKTLVVILYRDRVYMFVEFSKPLSPGAIKKKAYQLWHMFKAVVTNPQVLTTLSIAIYAWISGDGLAAWMVLRRCIAPVLPPWLLEKVDNPVLMELGMLLGNAISQRVFALTALV